eukprot:CAMPEP_0181207488 /NCGR_PEP_ID=MMETSP1096-20121128/21613_1 /TAXON_ID=156174 ORGANISM="Chrysochromulina ericina, Strain CCMP281" /NCGR_SAMPLE_ID=MMETSP1096 /ASSEMBLY_ACC=CAM_ASM_000453 /LENGTH=100 /DNA_ID=CAMNT_0023298493 /DNA_START=307 /DNA_END=609 /DNA_ORIENTATION=+
MHQGAPPPAACLASLSALACATLACSASARSTSALSVSSDAFICWGDKKSSQNRSSWLRLLRSSALAAFRVASLSTFSASAIALFASLASSALYAAAVPD